jgi:hypothetical protein
MFVPLARKTRLIWRPVALVMSGRVGMSGGFIADGHWHHVAFVVSGAGGRLYVDGVLRSSVGWLGAAGAVTSVAPLQIGRYDDYPNSFAGEVDEVTIWNRALTASELNHLKHRRLSGAEEGLLAYYGFDEPDGLVAENRAGAEHAGGLEHGPVRVASEVPVVLEPVAGSSLKLDGVDDYVAVPHATALNAYPLTVTAWVRTARNAPQVDALVSKYTESALNGYSLFLYNGRLRAWYFRDSANRIWDGALGIDGGFIADGEWHHVALVVNATRGELIVDGVLRGSLNWQGTPGSPTAVDALQVGRYWTYGNGWLGQVDEVTLWSIALSPAQIQSSMNLRLTGDEAGLVAYWRFDEGAGTAVLDASGSGHDGTLLGGALWAGSTAYLGDGGLHCVAPRRTPWWLCSPSSASRRSSRTEVNRAPRSSAYSLPARQGSAVCS